MPMSQQSAAPLFQPGQHVHFVGVGGFGLSAIARVMMQQGYVVSGSDAQHNAMVAALEADGMRFCLGHDAVNIAGADALIMTSAANSRNPEVQAAREQAIPVYKRSEIMAHIMQGQRTIAIAGTHGKTTTTAMTTHVLRQCGQDPSYIVGGIMANTGTNAALGSGPAFVIEADEYDNMFHGLLPHIAVLTSLEFDHPDFFVNAAAMQESFRRFLGLLPADGQIIVCADDPQAHALAQEFAARGMALCTYGLGEGAELRAVDIHTSSESTTFYALHAGQRLGPFHLPVPGLHNILNALAALLVAQLEGQPMLQAGAALADFRGTGRRFELRAEIHGIAIVDDYAHHPTAIRVTLDAARRRYPDRAIWAVWQPHTYNRTHSLFEDFARAFADADHVLVTDIYSVREQPIAGFGSADLAQAIQRHQGDAQHTPRFEDVLARLREGVKPPAVILIMSAGDAPRIGIEYLSYLESQR